MNLQTGILDIGIDEPGPLDLLTGQSNENSEKQTQDLDFKDEKPTGETEKPSGETPKKPEAKKPKTPIVELTEAEQETEKGDMSLLLWSILNRPLYRQNNYATGIRKSNFQSATSTPKRPPVWVQVKT